MNFLEPGTILNETYKVENLVGSGAFGTVYRVRHRFLGEQALKVLAASPDLDVESLFAEARVLVDLTHPHIVRTYDANIAEATAFITMEFAPLGTLSVSLEEQIRLTEDAVLTVGLQLASALAAAHSREPPLLHRDIKPSNVLRFESKYSSYFKLSDFGLAKQLDPMTRLTTSAGTVAYAPPEMSWGVADERSDIYSLGVTLYRCLTGVHPFPLLTAGEVSDRHATLQNLTHGRRTILPPSRYLLRASPLDEILMTCLEYDMFKRFRGGTEVLRALEEVRQQELPVES